ncbi:protein of unknown function [Streptococcus thermophilus]|nr:protein of unknown function [Streptococcus thermophilus]CAD0143943.1 protein of unknown function [Streptococcus thermophilus]
MEILRTDDKSQKTYYNDFVACMNGQVPKRLRMSYFQLARHFNATELAINF